MFYLFNHKGAFNKDLIGEFDDLDEAIEAGEKLNSKYTVEKMSGHVDVYGEPEYVVVSKN